jgi:hypothetical protein
MTEPDLPQGIRRSWYRVIRSIEAAIRPNHGLAIVEIRILVNKHGEAVQWTKPRATLLEPIRDAAHVIDLLVDMQSDTG